MSKPAPLVFFLMTFVDGPWPTYDAADFDGPPLACGESAKVSAECKARIERDFVDAGVAEFEFRPFASGDADKPGRSLPESASSDVDPDKLDAQLEGLFREHGVSARAIEGLRAARVFDVQRLGTMNVDALVAVPGVGAGTAAKIMKAIESLRGA